MSAIPAAGDRTSVRVNAALDAGGSVANIITTIAVLVFILFTAGLYFVLLAIISIPAQKQLAVKVARLFVTAAAASGTASGPISGPVPPAAPPPRREPAPAPAPGVAPGPVGPADAFAAIKRLAELRDMGAISTEDFEAKKVELLKKI